MLPALIGAGASLLGGILGRNAQKKATAQQQAFDRQQVAEMNVYNDPAQVRARAEAAGLNPLLFMAPGVGQQTGMAQSQASSGNYMGAALADAGMMIADQMSKNRELARLEKLSAENKKLAEKVQNLTIRPKVGGVYAQREAYNANSNTVLPRQRPVNGPANASDGLRPLPDQLFIDTRREVDNSPITTSSGFMVVDNPAMGRIYSPTLDGDEPLQWYDYPTLGINYVGSRVFEGAYNRYVANEAQPKRPSTDRLGTPSNNPWKKAFRFPQFAPPKLNLGARYGG
jgi:hypothetical protein